MNSHNARAFLAASLAAASLFNAAAEPQFVARIAVQGYTGATTLENFPVLVRIAEYDSSAGTGIEGFSYADCAAGGADISFVAADGETVLPHEIDTWNTSGESLAWVLLPSLSASGTTFTMRWADDDPPSVTASAVWSGAGYKSVWHLDIANNKTTDSVAAYTGTVSSPSAYCGAGAGLLGGGYHNEDNVDNCHNVYTTAVDGFTPTSGMATYSAWAKQVGGTANTAYPDQATYPKIKWGSEWGNCGAIWNSKNGGTANGAGIELCLEGKANMINTMYVRDSAATIGTLTLDTIYDKQWHYLVVTYDGTTRRFYVDGVLQPNFTGSYTIGTPTGTVRMGARADNNKDCVWTGDLDEMRFRGACSGADWISAEYANVANAAFLSYGPAQVGDNAVWVKGSPSEIGAPSPAYGFAKGLSAGDPVVFSVAESAVAGSGTSTNFLVGWTFEAVDLDTLARTTIASSEDPGAAIDSYSGTFSSYSEFTWLWERRDAFGLGGISAAANGGTYLDVAVDVTGLGYAAGASATLTVAYGAAADSLDKTAIATVTAPGIAVVRVARLQPGCPYYFKATLDDGGGNTAESAVTPLTTSPLTTGKRRIEYVEGTGTQWIDTGYKPTPNTRTVVDFQFTATTVQSRVFGIGIGDLFYTAYIDGNGYYGYSLANTGTWKAIDTVTPVDTERRLYDFNYIDGNGNHAYTVYTNGTGITVSPLEGTATRNATYTLSLGAYRSLNSADSPCTYISNHRIYSARIYEDGELKFALSPIAGDSGAVMFYDSVSKRTFTSAGIKQTDLAYTIGGPSVAASLLTLDGQRVVKLSFLAAPMDRPLCLAYGPVFGGDNPADWATTNAVATVPAGATSATAPIPATWGEDSALVARCYFDDGTDFPLWSDAVVWSDSALPIMSNVAADGTGGDQVVLTGTLSSFPGADCTLTVYTGTSVDDMAQAWSGLPGSTMDMTGSFTLTLYEGDTSSPRYISPGSTVYAFVEAVSDGKVARSQIASATTKGAPVFDSTSSSVNQMKCTFTGNLSDLGAGDSATVTLYVGETQDTLVAVETPVVRTATGAFSIAHTFDAFDKTYYWQFGAVSTTAGGRTLETRTDVASCTTSDSATYTWQPVDGDWNGSWSDTAHWSSSKTPCLGYPNSSAATADFKNCTTDNPVVVTVDGNYACGTLKCYGSAASDIAFVGTGVETSGLTGGGYGQSKIASDSTLEFRDMALTLNGDWEILRNTDRTNVVFRLSGVTGRVTTYFALAAGHCRAEFLNGTDFVGGTKFNIGGTNTVVVIDDSTIRANGSPFGFIFNADSNNCGGMEFHFRGKAPQMLSSKSFYPFQHHPDINHQFIFEVPAGGYAEAPIQLTHATTKMFYGGHGTADYHVVISPDSPALKSREAIEGNTLIYALAGFNLTETRTMDFAALPRRKGDAGGSLVWAKEDGTELDGFDSTARRVLLNLDRITTMQTVMTLR